jgi:hypothetical protein
MTFILRLRKVSLCLTAAILFLVAESAPAKTIGNHTAVYNAQGTLQPWTSWNDCLEREMKWYLNCPVENGYPRFVCMTFMEDTYTLRSDRPDFIPSMQNGMGIISYLKYYQHIEKKNPKVLEFARAMGDYLVKESLTPDTGKYPRFTRSTGIANRFPQPPDCGSQADHPYEIQPDKGAIAGYALALLYEETKDQKYMDQALQNARVLVDNMRVGDDTKTPWPFRVDYRNGEPRGQVCSNLSFMLRLFEKLDQLGHHEFNSAWDNLWDYIRSRQIPNLATSGSLWVQFFEDYEIQDNKNAWAPLNLARYLIEKKDDINPRWKEYSKALIDFTNKHFTSIYDGVLICGEQDDDRSPWGGILSTYGAVLAMYSAATGSEEYKGLAYQAMNYCLYAVSDDGCPGENAKEPNRGGWQEDCHTDKIHNLLDAMAAFPEWAK